MILRNKKWVWGIILITLTFILVFFGLSIFRLRPANTTEQYAKGIVYKRISIAIPRPIVIHIVEAQINLSHIKPFVTPADDLDADKPLKARTTTEFLKTFDLDVAINGSTFSPWYDFSLLGFFPHSDDWVSADGQTVSNKVSYGQSKGDANYISLYFIGSRIITGWGNDGAHNGISGIEPIITDGEINAEILNDKSIHPRTIVGSNQQGNILFMVVVDGRQFGYSQGIRLTEISQILLDIGVYNAINLDGGGSSTLVVKDENGNPLILNSPIHQHIPGRERPVANHLGIQILND